MTEAAIVDARTREIAEERQRALRALLARPLMTGGHPAFALVRRHADHLREWFARECGWTLRVERSHARLAKRAADHHDATRGAAGFQRSRYVLLCLALAVLERHDIQITLKNLGEALMEEAQDPALAASGFEFALDRQSQRSDLVEVCRLLLELGVLERIAGDEAAYLNQSGDALYDIRRPVLAALLVSARGPSALAGAGTSAERLAALSAGATPQGDAARRTALRHHLSRRLLDDPVVYLAELDHEEAAYFASQRGPMGHRLAQAGGLDAEHRAEGSALVDAAGDLTDVALPQQGTNAHATLLLAEFLAERVRAGTRTAVPMAEVEALLRQAAREHRKYWRKDTQEPGAERELAAIACGRLAALRLLARQGDSVLPLPAVCRFKLGEADLRPARQADLLGDAPDAAGAA
ncbi:MAG: TIGR02678 family protein [Ottowia sp.]|nr:TIGR02678 family protein [Ottowia sp.]